MKHIVIAGCSRTGKTMIANSFSKMGYIPYRMDFIKRAIYESFSLENEDWKHVSPKMAHLIATIISNSSSQEVCCIDTCHLYPEDIVNECIENTIIIFLGYPNINKNQKLRLVRKYDINTWTSHKSDKEMLNNIELGIKYSIEAKRQCEILDIPFFDTSYDFCTTVNNAYDYIRRNII